MRIACRMIESKLMEQLRLYFSATSMPQRIQKRSQHDIDDHKPGNDHRGENRGPKAEALLDNMSRLRAVTVQQEGQHEKTASPGDQRKQDEKRKMVAEEP